VLLYVGDGAKNYASVNKGSGAGLDDFTGVCGYGATKQLGENCAQQLKMAAQSLCNPDSIRVSILSESVYEVRGGIGTCCLCLTETGHSPKDATKCLPDGACNCLHPEL
jgi:hypothetical protein